MPNPNRSDQKFYDRSTAQIRRLQRLRIPLIGAMLLLGFHATRTAVAHYQTYQNNLVAMATDAPNDTPEVDVITPHDHSSPETTTEIVPENIALKNHSSESDDATNDHVVNATSEPERDTPADRGIPGSAGDPEDRGTPGATDTPEDAGRPGDSVMVVSPPVQTPVQTPVENQVGASQELADTISEAAVWVASRVLRSSSLGKDEGLGSPSIDEPAVEHDLSKNEPTLTDAQASEDPPPFTPAETLSEDKNRGDIAPVTIVNPADSRVRIHYLVNDKVFSLAAGKRHVLENDAPVRVSFHRGGKFGDAVEVLISGQYEFAATEQGWDLRPSHDIKTPTRQ